MVVTTLEIDCGGLGTSVLKWGYGVGKQGSERGAGLRKVASEREGERWSSGAASSVFLLILEAVPLASLGLTLA